MFEFFRRYQRAFFIVITSVIVISFSFFGTYQAFQGGQAEDKVAFTAVDGTKVLSSELNDMITFLSRDSGSYGNGLNDGVVVTDLLQTGLGEVIAAKYMQEIGQELQPKLEREKRYTGYKHPRAPFLTADQIWSYYAPNIKKNLDRLKQVNQASEADGFQARVALFLAEQNFPAAYLKQILRYQESTHKWLPQDATLAQQDLSLFGYHSAQDWFGRRFLELSAEFIINAAKVAERKGYKVSKEEALASLFRNAERSFHETKANEQFGIQTAADYFQQSLRHLMMDQGRAVKVWSQVLLFRRLFFDTADSVLVDTTGYDDFYRTLNEYVDIDLYQLPQALRFNTVRDLEKFVLYMDAVRGSDKNGHFTLPKEQLTVDEIKKNYPEFVERGFHLKWTEVNKEELETKIGVKATWEWQVQDSSWALLQSRYVELTKKEAKTAEERLALLDTLDAARRASLDTFSRQKIVDLHPEWVAAALDTAEVQEEVVYLREAGGTVPFDGIQNRRELIAKFLSDDTASLATYSQDDVHIYRFTVVDRALPEVLLSFETLQKDGTLDLMLNKKLEGAYERLRTRNSAAFVSESGDWRPFEQVKNEVALLYFDELFKSLDQEIIKAKEEVPSYVNWSNQDKARIAVYFLPYLQMAKDAVSGNPDEETLWIAESEEAHDKVYTQDGFKLVKSRQRVVRGESKFVVDPAVAFATDMNMMSEPASYQKSGPHFYTVVAKGFLPADDLVREKVLAERKLLGHEAICALGDELLQSMKQKQSLVAQADLIQGS